MLRRVVVIGVAGMLGGCPLQQKPDDTAPLDVGDTDGDSDADADADSDADSAFVYFTGDIGSDGVSASGHFGLSGYVNGGEDPDCVGEGLLTSTGPAPEGCPSCDWAFTMTPVSGTTVVGDCEDLGWTDGFLDGRFQYPWGFAEDYIYDYDGIAMPMTDAILVHDYDYWYVFAFSAPAYGIYQTYGDASRVEFVRETFRGSGYYYYYP